MFIVNFPLSSPLQRYCLTSRCYHLQPHYTEYLLSQLQRLPPQVASRSLLELLLRIILNLTKLLVILITTPMTLRLRLLAQPFLI